MARNEASRPVTWLVAAAVQIEGNVKFREKNAGVRRFARPAF